MTTEAEARERLLAAIADIDEATFGPRAEGEILTNYVVVYAHRNMSGDPADDADAVDRLHPPGQPLWQTLGLLRAEARQVEVDLTAPDDE